MWASTVRTAAAAFALVAVLLGGTACAPTPSLPISPADPIVAPEPPSVIGPPLIAHALGGVDGHTYTNSLEAFTRSYALGIRRFEADVSLTRDGVPVLVHGWAKKTYERLGWEHRYNKQRQVMTLDEFVAEPILGQYTALTFADLVDLMQQYPDIVVMLDARDISGSETARLYREILAATDGLPEVRSRLIPGGYRPEMVAAIRALHPFSAIDIYWHAEGDRTPGLETAEAFAEWCRSNGVGIISISIGNYIDAEAQVFMDAGLQVFVFSSEDAAEVVALLSKGVAVVGTDSLDPAFLIGDAVETVDATLTATSPR